MPVVHVVTGPIAPFAGGFVAGGRCRARPAGAGLVGLMLAVALSMPAALVGWWLVGKDQASPAAAAAATGGVFAYALVTGALGAAWGGAIGRRDDEAPPRNDPTARE